MQQPITINGEDVAANQATATPRPQPPQYVYTPNLNIPRQTVWGSNVVGARITASSPLMHSM